MAKGKLKTVRGVHDILPASAARWHEVERQAREIFVRYGYGEIRIPVFEHTEVFSRGIGEETDIVTKEMYTFEDKGGDSITLRPEATASICRAYVQHGLYNQPGVTKLFCVGPMFRYERPQAGRLRQFHQIDAEAFGSDDPALDADVIVMLIEFLETVGLKGIRLQINSLGDAACRPAYGAALRDFLREEGKGFGPEIRERIERNPLRFLDSKDPAHQEILSRAPTIDGFWNEACRSHLDAVCGLLKRAGINFEIAPRLVRGLDYYCLTVFEVTSEKLGAQNAVCGGGRYDGLVEELGGPPTPALGFAIGLERLIQLASEEKSGEGGKGDAGPAEGAVDVFIVPLGEAASGEAFGLAAEVRSLGIRAEISFGGGSLKSQMRRADRSRARFVLLIGEKEIEGGAVSFRNMRESRQEEVARGDVAEMLKGLVHP